MNSKELEVKEQIGHLEVRKQMLHKIIEIIDDQLTYFYQSLEKERQETSSQTMLWGLDKRQEKLLSAKDTIHYHYTLLLNELNKAVVLISDEKKEEEKINGCEECSPCESSKCEDKTQQSKDPNSALYWVWENPPQQRETGGIAAGKCATQAKKQPFSGFTS